MIRHGITRTVLVTRRWAFKVPSLQYRYPIRGWLANRSEWMQRARFDVHPPLFTLGFVVSVYRRAVPLTDSAARGYPTFDPPVGYDGDEAKPSSWGWINGRWALIDYNRAWTQPRGIVGGMYYWNQERLARKWAEL